MFVIGLSFSVQILRFEMIDIFIGNNRFSRMNSEFVFSTGHQFKLKKLLVGWPKKRSLVVPQVVDCLSIAFRHAEFDFDSLKSQRVGSFRFDA